LIFISVSVCDMDFLFIFCFFVFLIDSFDWSFLILFCFSSFIICFLLISRHSPRQVNKSPLQVTKLPRQDTILPWRDLTSAYMFCTLFDREIRNIWGFDPSPLTHTHKRIFNTHTNGGKLLSRQSNIVDVTRYLPWPSFM
jgi:hypothetical protein